eukprot:SAG22_NODE_283_length_13027_cov_25.568535_3_plen_289_part_00
MIAQAAAPGHAQAAPSPGDLDILPDALWAHVGSYLAVADLGRLARASPRFPPRLVDDAARLSLQRFPARVRAWVPGPRPGGATRWLRRLAEAHVLATEPLAFTEHGPDVAVAGNRAGRGSGPWQAAVCRRAGGAEMRAGAHRAAFTGVTPGHIEAAGDAGPWVGVVGPGFDAAKGLPAAFKLWEPTPRQVCGGSASHGGPPSSWLGIQSSMLYTSDLRCSDRRGCSIASVASGSTIELELDLDNGGSLAVYVDRQRVGLAVEPCAASGLAGPLRWAVDVGYGSVVEVH